MGNYFTQHKTNKHLDITMKHYLSFALTTLFALCGVMLCAQQPSPVMLTTWGRELLDKQPLVPHQEHPCPLLRRERWQTLNGEWLLSVPGDNTTRNVRVPFPVESVLSGITKPLREMSYRHLFTIPDDWNNGLRIMLHFGAVDYETTVFVNGTKVGEHNGGYSPFTFDITDALKPKETPTGNPASQQLEVKVVDPCDAGEQMCGNQSVQPTGTRYTGASGIWQSVWIEAVSPSHIVDLNFEIAADVSNVIIRPLVAAPKSNLFLSAELFLAGKKVAETYGGIGGTLRVAIPESQRFTWSPEEPNLYDVHVRLFDRGTVIDDLRSYFAARMLSLKPDADGRLRLMLNGKPYFMQAVIDQGYWSDGIYTPPSDAAIEAEIRTIKMLGFNSVRKLAKVESQRWYFWCDTIGLLVWQDVPSAANRTAASRERFASELIEIVKSRRHHPSIAVWTLFNEGRGQHQTEQYAQLVRNIDATRLIDTASGWNDTATSDFQDTHKFPGPDMPDNPDYERAALLGSFGGITLVVKGSTWAQDVWGHSHVANSEVLLQEYQRLHGDLIPLIKRGIVGAAFHQLVDVETECNGLITYDRKNLKVPPEKIKEINEAVIRAAKQ
jgi:beta-galactosidase/beta-glucuronidase